jgi:hypothetical protein
VPTHQAGRSGCRRVGAAASPFIIIRERLASTKDDRGLARRDKRAMTLTKRALPTTVARSRTAPGLAPPRSRSKGCQTRGGLAHPLINVPLTLSSNLNRVWPKGPLSMKLSWPAASTLVVVGKRNNRGAGRSAIDENGVVGGAAHQDATPTTHCPPNRGWRGQPSKYRARARAL